MNIVGTLWPSVAVATAVALLIGTVEASAFDTSKLGQRGSMWLEDLMPLIGGTSRLKRQVNHALAKALDSMRRFW